MLRGFFTLVDLLGVSLWLSLFSGRVSVLVLAFSDFFAGSSVAFFSLLDSSLVEGLEVSLAGGRVLGGAFREEGGAVVCGTGLRSGVPAADGIGFTVAAGVATGAIEAAAVGAAVAVVLLFVLVLVTPTLSCALKDGAGTP